jgi:hypothetical protein
VKCSVRLEGAIHKEWIESVSGQLKEADLLGSRPQLSSNRREIDRVVGCKPASDIDDGNVAVAGGRGGRGVPAFGLTSQLSLAGRRIERVGHGGSVEVLARRPRESAPTIAGVKHGIFVAPFGRFADPHKLVDLAATAEESGWDGLFLWDHVLRPESNEIIDPWVALGAMAAATTTIRLGPMVTPVPRRRPIKLAREILTVDLMSDGRLTVGVGSGTDTGGELSRFDEIVDARARGARLDEGLDIITRLLEGETLAHVGEHFDVDGVSLEPRPVQRPRPPVWCAARGAAMKPVRRAARYEGMFPIDIDADSFQRMLDEVETVRGSLDGFDVCLRTDTDGTPPAFADRGATWMLRAFPAVVEHEKVFDEVMHGPPH